MGFCKSYKLHKHCALPILTGSLLLSIFVSVVVDWQWRRKLFSNGGRALYIIRTQFLWRKIIFLWSDTKNWRGHQPPLLPGSYTCDDWQSAVDQVGLYYICNTTLNKILSNQLYYLSNRRREYNIIFQLI